MTLSAEDRETLERAAQGLEVTLQFDLITRVLTHIDKQTTVIKALTESPAINGRLVPWEIRKFILTNLESAPDPYPAPTHQPVLPAPTEQGEETREERMEHAIYDALRLGETIGPTARAILIGQLSDKKRAALEFDYEQEDGR